MLYSCAIVPGSLVAGYNPPDQVRHHASDPIPVLVVVFRQDIIPFGLPLIAEQRRPGLVGLE